MKHSNSLVSRTSARMSLWLAETKQLAFPESDDLPAVSRAINQLS